MDRTATTKRKHSIHRLLSHVYIKYTCNIVLLIMWHLLVPQVYTHYLTIVFTCTRTQSSCLHSQSPYLDLLFCKHRSVCMYLKCVCVLVCNLSRLLHILVANGESVALKDVLLLMNFS